MENLTEKGVKSRGSRYFWVGDGKGGGQCCPHAYSIQEQRFNIKTNQPKNVLQSKNRTTYKREIAVAIIMENIAQQYK